MAADARTATAKEEAVAGITGQGPPSPSVWTANAMGAASHAGSSPAQAPVVPSVAGRIVPAANDESSDDDDGDDRTDELQGAMARVTVHKAVRACPHTFVQRFFRGVGV